LSVPWVFDQQHYDALNAARGESLRRLLPDLKQRLGIETVLDLGCGLGHYAAILHESGFRVLAIDGRKENIEEARRRFPQVEFRVADAQDPALSQLGSFDLVFCFGLLYHLENPFLVLRNLAKLTPKATLIEGIVYPSPEPAMVLMDENNGVDQGLNFMAFYPSEPCLIKMLRRSGFAYCYNPEKMPGHREYHTGGNGFRRRTVIIASKSSIESPTVVPWPDPSPEFGPWSMLPLYPVGGIPSKAYGFVDRLLYGKARRSNRP
jgi:SAM-dependent methyltransferase